jgi:hypothetical protein
MEPENHYVTTAVPDAASVGPTYPTLLLRLWLVRARLSARAGVRRVWPRDTADDRRLAAMLFAVGTALVMLLGCAFAGVGRTTLFVHVGIGFFLALGSGLALLFGPDDYDCADERATVTGLLPGAKRVWDEQRAAARAARAARKAERAAARETSAENLVALTPVGRPTPLPTLEGDGAYAVPVLGEVHLGRILAAACPDELPPVGHDKVVSAVVRIEHPSRDSGVVSVAIAGRTVGHLSRADARALRRVGREGEKFQCRAAIHAGWKGGRVHYDLRLDVDLGADRPVEAVGP